MIVRDQTNFAAGVFFAVAGLSIAGVASTYEFGSASKMGPGYFPFWIGILLAGLGGLLMIAAIRIGSIEVRLERWDLRSLGIIVASVVLFGLLLDWLGLFLSLVVLAMTAASASHQYNWVVATLTALGLATGGVLIFIYGLNLPIGVLPAFLRT